MEVSARGTRSQGVVGRLSGTTGCVIPAIASVVAVEFGVRGPKHPQPERASGGKRIGGIAMVWRARPWVRGIVFSLILPYSMAFGAWASRKGQARLLAFLALRILQKRAAGHLQPWRHVCGHLNVPAQFSVSACQARVFLAAPATICFTGTPNLP